MATSKTKKSNKKKNVEKDNKKDDLNDDDEEESNDEEIKKKSKSVSSNNYGGMNYTKMAFFALIVLIIGIGIGFYLIPKTVNTAVEVTATTTTTTLVTPLGNTGGSAGAGGYVTPGKLVKLDYIGKLENGTVFDTSIEDEAKKAGIYVKGRPYQPFTFVAGRGQVIPGFDEAVLGMKVGQEKEVTIPPEKAYSQGPLAGKTLIFKIWLREIKEPVKVELTIVNDKNCGSSCDTSKIVGVTKSLFPDVKITEVDSNSKEGKKLIEKYNILLVPAYLFSDNLDKAENYARNALAFEKKGDKFVLRDDVTGAKEYASEEAKLKAEEEAKKSAEQKCEAIKKVEKPELTAFVVSNCPFGMQMQRVLTPVAKVFAGNADINVRYLGSITDGKITSMHGDKEAQENLRQICLREEQKDTFWDYVSCYIKEGKSGSCMDEAKVNKTKLTSCMNDTSRGIKYAQADFDKQNKFSVTGSPTLIMGDAKVNEFDFGGRSVEALKTLICCSFKDKPDVCNKKMDTRQAATSFSVNYSSEGGGGSSSANTGGAC